MLDLQDLATLAFALVLAAGANARFARAVTKEEPGAPFRRRVKKKFGYQSLMVKWSECPWCLGFWTAWPATALAWFPIAGLQLWWLFVPAGFAVAHATGRWNHNHAPVPIVGS